LITNVTSEFAALKTNDDTNTAAIDAKLQTIINDLTAGISDIIAANNTNTASVITKLTDMLTSITNNFDTLSGKVDDASADNIQAI